MRMTKVERDELFASTDLRLLTKQPFDASDRDEYVSVYCPVHGGQGDLAVYHDHAYCYSSKCSQWIGPYDAAAMILGLWTSDGMWASDHFKQIIESLKQAKKGTMPAVSPKKTLTQEELEELHEQYQRNLIDSPDLVRRFCDWRGFESSTVLDYGIGHTGKAWTIPITDSRGTLRTIRYRADEHLYPDAPVRYWGVRGGNAASVPYGLFTLPQQPWPWMGRVIVLVEGEFDMIASQLMGIPAICLTNGAAMKRDRQGVFETLAKYFDYILTAYDQDEGGQQPVLGYNTTNGRHVQGIAEILGDKHINVRWPRSLGKDPNEVLQNGKNLRMFVRSALEHEIGVTV